MGTIQGRLNQHAESASDKCSESFNWHARKPQLVV